MGMKRRAMFNPKFKHSKKSRWEKGQAILKGKDNSEIIELIKEQQPDDKITDTDQIVEEMIKEVEEMVAQVSPTFTSTELKKKKKAELLEIANTLNCSVTNKNTKAQIITSIEKQSA